VPARIFESEGAKKIIERYKEQVQGNLVVVGVEIGWKLKKISWQNPQLIYFISIC